MTIQRKCIIDNTEIETIFKPAVIQHMPRSVKKKTDRSAVILAGEKINVASLRYRTFVTKGTKCVGCGCEGTVWAIERHVGSNGKNYDKWHVNLYAKTDKGEVLMTKDHIIPRSKGGLDQLENLQPMCSVCNHAKDNPPPKNNYENSYSIVVPHKAYKGTKIYWQVATVSLAVILSYVLGLFTAVLLLTKTI